MVVSSNSSVKVLVRSARIRFRFFPRCIRSIRIERVNPVIECLTTRCAQPYAQVDQLGSIAGFFLYFSFILP